MAAQVEQQAQPPAVHDFGEFTEDDYQEVDEHGIPLLLSAALDVTIALHAEEEEEQEGGQDGEAEGLEETEEGKDKIYLEEDYDEDDDEEEDDDDDEDISLGDENDNNVIEDYLDPYMDQDHPDRMKLTTVEYNWALSIKDAIENNPELDNLSDFMYSQLAIICEGDVVDAMERARGLQVFRHEYNMVESYQEGRRALQELMELQPLVFLGCNFSNIDGTWLSVCDLAKTKNLNDLLDSEEKLIKYFMGYYYVHHCWSPDLETVRKGSIIVAECEGLGFSIRSNFKIWMRMGDECLKYYPSINEGRHYNTGVLFNVLFSMAMKFLPKEKAQKFKVGCTSSSRMDKLLLVPNAEKATRKMLANMMGCLERRFENENKFCLPPRVADRSRESEDQ